MKPLLALGRDILRKLRGAEASLAFRFRVLVTLLFVVMTFLFLQALLILVFSGKGLQKGRDIAKVYLPQIESLSQLEADILGYHGANLEAIFSKSSEQMSEKIVQADGYLGLAQAEITRLQSFNLDSPLRALLDLFEKDLKQYRFTIEKVLELLREEQIVEAFTVFDKEVPPRYQVLKYRLASIREEIARVSSEVASTTVHVLEQAWTVALIISVSGGFFALMSLGGVAVWRDIKAIVTKIQQREGELKVKNQQIVLSIGYAERIQRSVLHGLNDLSDIGLESFMIFRPKDVVSGDFNWFSKHESVAVLAAVDCCGHGVPGAFMSLIGHLLLKDAIAHCPDLEPAAILDVYSCLVYEALRQRTESRAHDTIDICLCVYDSRSRKMKFAGAKRPLYIKKSGSPEIIEIKGDRYSLGSTPAHLTRFTSHVIDCEPGVVFFLTTDGLADQSNFEGKRLGTLKLKSILSELKGESLKSYEEQFQLQFSQYQGSADQRDDISIIGIRPLI